MQFLKSPSPSFSTAKRRRSSFLLMALLAVTACNDDCDWPNYPDEEIEVEPETTNRSATDYVGSCSCDKVVTAGGMTNESLGIVRETMTFEVADGASPNWPHINACNAVAQDLDAEERRRWTANDGDCEDAYGNDIECRDEGRPTIPLQSLRVTCSPSGSPSIQKIRKSVLPPAGRKSRLSNAKYGFRRNKNATYVGEMSESSTVKISASPGWRTFESKPEPWGRIFISGGDCRNQSCPMVIDGLEAGVKNFTIGGRWKNARIENVRLRNIGPWKGTKQADGSFSFRGKVAMASARVRGKDRAGKIRLKMNLKGKLVDRKLKIARRTFHLRYFELEGEHTSGEFKVDFDLRFNLGKGAPTGVVKAKAANCRATSYGFPLCDYGYSAEDSKTYHGGSVSSYRWYDANGRLLGTKANIGPYPFAFGPDRPLRLVVKDGDGRSDTVLY